MPSSADAPAATATLVGRNCCGTAVAGDDGGSVVGDRRWSVGFWAAVAR
jgi:hypothetical protein